MAKFNVPKYIGTVCLNQSSCKIMSKVKPMSCVYILCDNFSDTVSFSLQFVCDSSL